MSNQNNTAKNFQDKLNSTEKIVFYINSFSEGNVERKITFKDNKTILKKQVLNLEKKKKI